MTKDVGKRNGVERLERVLDVYGAAAARWPAGEREALLGLVASDARARRLLAEAEALDRVLALAPSGDEASGLEQRIVAAAAAGGDRPARVVPITAARSRPRPAGEEARRPGRLWPAAAVLAASFLFGVYLGSTSLLQRAFQITLDYAEMSGGVDDVEDLLGPGSGSTFNGEMQL